MEFYEANELRVALGSVDLLEQDPLKIQNIQVSSVKTHGRFNKLTLANNLALLKVRIKVPESLSILMKIN